MLTSEPWLDATYFDGNSSQPHAAKVSVLPSRVEITFANAHGEPQAVLWEHAEIHPTDLPGSQKVGIKYGEYPHQYLEIDAKAFYQAVKEAYPQAPYLQSVHNFFMSRGYSWLLGGAVVVMGFLTLCYWALLPLVTDAAVAMIPVRTEAELGREMAEQLLATEPVDTVRSALLTQFYHQLKIKTPYDIRVSVVKRPITNAFAVPGGQIVVYSALLDSLRSYPELVALLGHETGHIQRRHSLRMITRGLILQLIVSTIFQDVSGLYAILLDNATEVVHLSHGRDAERDADQYGLQVMADNRIDPRGMRDLFTLLKAEEKGKDATPIFLRSHPTNDQRIAEINVFLRSHRIQTAPHDSLTYYWQRIQAGK